MRIIFMGTAEFAVLPLEHLILNQFEVVAVYTQPDKPASRGRYLAASPVKKVALANGLPLVQPLSFKKAPVVEELTGFHPDIIVVAAFGQILTPSVLEMPRYGCLNIHPSLLPRFRGASPIATAIIVGDEFTGVSIMKMDSGVDTGPVLVRAQIPIEACDTTGSLTVKLSRLAASLLQEALVRWHDVVAQIQNEDEATYCSLIAKEDGEIDWNLPAVDIWRRVRAFQPWPSSYTWWRGQRLKIIEAIPRLGEVSPDVGRVVALAPAMGEAEAAFGVGTGDGILGVIRVQLEGKRAMSAAEFWRGQRQLIGAVLPSS